MPGSIPAVPGKAGVGGIQGIRQWKPSDQTNDSADPAAVTGKYDVAYRKPADDAKIGVGTEQWVPAALTPNTARLQASSRRRQPRLSPTRSVSGSAARAVVPVANQPHRKAVLGGGGDADASRTVVRGIRMYRRSHVA